MNDSLLSGLPGNTDTTMTDARSNNTFLVYNTSFFDVSQTFIYHQVKALQNMGQVHLLGSQFMNPHGFPMECYTRHEVRKIRGLIGRVTGKFWKRSFFDRQSSSYLHKLFRETGFSMVHAHFGTNALDILPYAQRYGVPMVVSFHGADASRMVRMPHYTRRLPALFNYASAIIISGRHMAGTLNLHPWSDKVHHVVYGVQVPEQGSYGKADGTGTVKILHSGRLVPKKGVPDLIRVFGELQSEVGCVELHIAGGGEELPRCRELVDMLNLQTQVIFHGPVSNSRVQELLEQADVFVLNSRTAPDGDMEGTPVTLLEAMAMGKAVVSTRHAGIPDVIKHEQNGLLADEYSNTQLKENIKRLLTDSELRHALGKKAGCHIKKLYSVETMTYTLGQIFSGIVTSAGK